MSWLYSLALAEEFSAGKFSDGAPSAQSKSTSTPEMYLSHGKTTERSRLSRFGMTCELLTDDRGEELLISFLEDSLARISASQVKDAGSMERDQGYGAKWRALSVKYDLDTSSWRTHLCLFEGDLIECSEILPKWGMMLSGELWELTTQVLHIVESGSGFWPTPIASAANTIKTQRDRPHGKRLDEAVCGHLNPQWVEWLMGWPIGHTGLEPLETDRYREWWRWHGEF